MTRPQRSRRVTASLALATLSIAALFFVCTEKRVVLVFENRSAATIHDVHMGMGPTTDVELTLLQPNEAVTRRVWLSRAGHGWLEFRSGNDASPKRIPLESLYPDVAGPAAYRIVIDGEGSAHAQPEPP